MGKQGSFETYGAVCKGGLVWVWKGTQTESGCCFVCRILCVQHSGAACFEDGLEIAQLMGGSGIYLSLFYHLTLGF